MWRFWISNYSILFNTLKVIGIHKQGDIINNINYGIFIGEIINEKKDLRNFIYIYEEDVGQNIRIINSYEQYSRELKFNDEIKEEYKNEREIKECKIEINGKEISFCYFYKFQKIGKYQIKYTFGKN